MKIIRRILAEEFSFLLACPAVIWQIFFLYLPLAVLIGYSFFEYPSFTLEYYNDVMSSVYLRVIARSFFVALSTAFWCLLLAYPVAYFIAMKVPKQYKTMFLFLLILPSWTSLIVQIYAWFFLLDGNSFLCRFFSHIGLMGNSKHLLNNYFAILLVMIAVYLPFMILPLYTALQKIDKRLLEASADLGANRVQTFLRIVFPLSLPGLYVGLLLVFLPAFGEFAIPTLLGGSKFLFWGNLIVDKFFIARNWRSGSAVAIVGIFFSCLFIVTLYGIIKLLSSNRKRRISR